MGLAAVRFELRLFQLHGIRSIFPFWHFTCWECIVLVLSRKVGERIWIGNEICVTVVRLTSGGVRLGIEAPAELPVIREELKVRQGGEVLFPENISAETHAPVEIPGPGQPLAENLPASGSRTDSELKSTGGLPDDQAPHS